MESCKKVLPIVLAACIIIVVIICFALNDKQLDIESEEIQNLYSYLGEIDIYHCGGLNVYNDETVTKENLKQENTLCMAYYKIDDIKANTSNDITTTESGSTVCKVGENTTILAEDDICSYTTITKDELNEAYKEIYGDEINDYSNFYISRFESCNLEGEEYICGDIGSYTYSLASDATIYRALNKAVKQMNGDIIIYEYFLRVSDNRCYSANNNNNEITQCTQALEEQTIDLEFVKEYGSLYKHTFKKSDNNSYYWLKSEPKS